MKINEAIKLRIEKLLKERNITRYRLAMNAAIDHGTLKNIMHNTIDDNKMSTVAQIAFGFDMTLSEFLNDALFDEDNLTF